MNKLFTKIAGVAIGLTMAIGVGVVVASNKEAVTVRAATIDVAYTLTITTEDLTINDSSQSSTYAKYAGDQTATAVCDTDDTKTYDVTFNITSVMPNSSNLQFQAQKGVLYNKTSLGKISSVNAGNVGLTTVIGSSENPSSSSANGAYFVVKKTSKGAANVASIVVKFTLEEEQAGTTYDITTSVSNGTYTGSTKIAENGSASITISPNEGYKLPALVSVTGATSSYDSSTGVISLSNPTGAVSVSATCPALETYAITKTATNGTVSGDSSIVENGEATVTFAPNEGYKLPTAVSVTGATSSYDSTTGVVTLSNPTGAVSVSATMDEATLYTFTTSLTRLTASPSSGSLYENGTASITLSLTDSAKYSLPTTITVTNCEDYDYNSSTGVITLNGAQGNVVITASAIAKPAEASETFDFSDSNLWDSSTTDGNGDKVYTQTIDLITMRWESNKQSSKAGAYWNPGRIYQNHIVTISAVTGEGAVTSIKSVIFHSESGRTSGTTGATVTVTKPTSGKGTVTKGNADSNFDIEYTITGTVTEFTIQASAQTRWSTVEVVYEKDQSEISLNSISATCNPVLVSQTIKPTITYNPQNASNKNVTYQFVEGTTSLADVASDGTITAKGAGTARLQITPEDTNASAIVIDVTINALPSIYGVEVGKKYAMTSSGYELTGIYDSATPNYGLATSYSGSPSNSFPIRIVNGLYANTVAMEVEINSETAYLSYDAAANGNSLNYVSTISRESSWIFAEVDSELVIRNVEVYSRFLAFSSNRFACYQALSTSIVSPEFIEIAEVKTDKEYVQDFVDLYMHMTDYDQGGTKGSTNGYGWCSDGQHSYYLTAKAGYNSIIYGNSTRESLWTGDSDFAAAKARYDEWARINKDAAPYDGNDTIQSRLNSAYIIGLVGEGNSSTAAIIVIVSLVSITAIGGYFFLRKRKVQ